MLGYRAASNVRTRPNRITPAAAPPALLRKHLRPVLGQSVNLDTFVSLSDLLRHDAGATVQQACGHGPPFPLPEPGFL